jgi:mono/diheme cytochrome c family protein
MKKSIKIILFTVLGIIVILFILLMVVNFSGIPYYDVQAEDLFVQVTDARVEEGARMAGILCLHCHGSTDGKLGGNYMADAADFGKIYAPNITQNPELGIADYTDGELAYLLRTGIKKDGQYAPVWMPKFPNLSDEDLYSIIAFLRSDNPMVQPSDNKPPELKPNLLAKMLSRTVFKPLPYPEGPVLAPPASDRVAYGKYLATAKFDCFGCHSADFKSIDIMNPERSKGYFGGGNVLLDKQGKEIRSANLTMDKETGIGSWSEEDFIRTLRFGMRPDNTPLKYPMVPAPMITDEEASDIWAYLQTIPVVVNKVD